MCRSAQEPVIYYKGKQPKFTRETTEENAKVVILVFKLPTQPDLHWKQVSSQYLTGCRSYKDVILLPDTWSDNKMAVGWLFCV